MEIHKLLQKQISKHLSIECTEDSSFKAFIQAVNDSYLSFERDNDLMDHSFKESEKEYNEVNQNLKKEYILKQESISNLYKSLQELDQDYEITKEDEKNDLLLVSKYLGEQISKRKETEKKLFETVELLKALLNNLQAGILVVDADNKILFINQHLCDMREISVSPEEMLGEDRSKFIDQSKMLFEDPEEYINRIYDIVSQKQIVTGELLETLDNRFLERDYIPIFTGNQDCVHLWKSTDVTQRIKNRNLLEQSEERSKIIMNASLNAIITVNKQGVITFWNNQAEIIFGWKKEEIIGKVFSDFIVPRYNKERYDEGIVQFLKTGEDMFLNKQLELDAVNKNGNIFLSEASIIPITQNGETFFCSFIQDISKRKEAENQLSQTVELLKTLLANFQSGIMVEDKNSNLLFTNQLFCDMCHISTLPDEMIGIDSTIFIENQKKLFKDFKSFVKRVDEIINLKEIVIGELLETTENVFLERDYIPIFIGNEYKGHLWKYTDVSQRIKTQNLLEQSEERNRLIMNASLNAIITIDIDGIITFWNKQAETIFGWKNKEVLGKILTKTIFPEEQQKDYEIAMGQYMKTGEVSVLKKQTELIGLHKNGYLFPVEISIIPIKQNGEMFFSSFIQDISERKKAENNLKFQEEKYRNIIANMNLGLIEVDKNQIIQFANQSFSDISGYEIDEVLGKNPMELFVYEEDQKILNSKNKLREKGISDIYQISVKNKKGELKWWAISGAPNYDDKGNLVGSIGIHLDITEQKQLEIELEREKVKAQEASKAKEVFLANMSHEIRTPLNAIIGFLRELGKQELSELQKSYIENSSIASKHLLAIINNILDISKIEAGEMSLEEEDFLIENSIDKVIRVLKPLAKQKGLRLIATISKSVNPVFKADALRLEQILFNLIGNALKFTSKGKIILNCDVISDHINFQELHISITDTGIGMEQSFAETIFTKFSQEDKSITRKFGGTGLGMAITKELVQLMNGEIKVESEKNKGTTVHVIIHLAKGDIDNIKNIQPEININIEGISILLVEDSKMNRMVVQNSMQYFNCDVTEAESGIEALEILKKQNFDIILMDIQMPEMDGIEATRIIRKKLKLDTPIIALTANAFKTEIDKCRKAGMDDYVTKPFDEIVLLETIARHTVNKIKILHEVEEIILDEKLYDLSILNNLSRGNDEFVLKMLAIFIDQTKETLEKAEKALAVDDLPELGRLIHKIKPSVESLGISLIRKEIKILELIAKETKSKEEIKLLFLKVKNILDQVVIQLQEKELIE
jgi:PAS domain S-box-containing protein